MRYFMIAAMVFFLSGCATLGMRSQDKQWGKCAACGEYQRPNGMTTRVTASKRQVWAMQVVCPNNHFYFRDVTSPIVGRVRPGNTEAPMTEAQRMEVARKRADAKFAAEKEKRELRETVKELAEKLEALSKPAQGVITTELNFEPEPIGEVK